jgi:hypothetical protein
LTSSVLARSYLVKAEVRLKALQVLLDNRAHSDVVREAQEIVELALKAMLRAVGVEPPKFHDVGPFLLENKEKFPVDVRGQLEKLAAISGYLRKEREFSFYGDIDFVPTERYSSADAEKARDDAVLVVNLASKVIT